jgi:dipeptidyl aminopeptidase/acylaminoacyl peptidase
MVSFRDFQPAVRFPAHPVVAVAPDGCRVAYVDDASGQFNLSVLDLAAPGRNGGPARLTGFVERRVRGAGWHPGGRWLVANADANGDECWRLYRVDAAGGEPEPLVAVPAEATWPVKQWPTESGDPFSPDGELLAYAANDRVPGEQDVLVLELRTGHTRRLFHGEGQTYPVHWSPDGTALTVTTSRQGVGDDLVHLVPADGGPATLLTDPAADNGYQVGPWLPDGSGFLVISNQGREYDGLGVMDATTGAIRWLDTPDWNVELVALSRDGRTLVWTVNVAGVSRLRARDLHSGAELPVPELPAGVVGGLSLAPDGRRLLLVVSTATRPTTLAAVDLAAGTLTWLADHAPVAARTTTLVEPTLVACPARDGRCIPAYLYRPARCDGTVGVVISVHGGPVQQERPGYRYDGLYQYLLARGVAVLAPNIRGSAGYGRAYARQIFRRWGGPDLDDIEDVTAYLRGLGWIDPARIGLYGGSYGGFVVLSCLSRLPQLDWAAAVDLYGPSNLVTLARAMPATWRGVVAAQLGDPDTEHDDMLARSPASHTDRIRAPLLVLQGARDPRTPQHESDQIVERLRARGVPVRYDVYPDEGHGFTRRENENRARSDAADFLVEHLAGAPGAS